MQSNNILPPAISILKASDKDFKLFAELIYNHFGINLGIQKKTLLESRLNKVIRKHNLTSYKEYYNYLINSNDEEELLNLIDHISTNHTYFFREPEHFKLLSSQIFQETAERTNDIRIWCAGCSSGEEPYTISMLANEFEEQYTGHIDISILATDISSTALTTAIQREYSKEKIESIDKILLNKYFTKFGENYKVADNVFHKILFKRLNFMDDYFPFKSKFDIIFCRNVMIYFDQPTRDKLISKFYNALNTGGYLFVGHSESLDRRKTKFKYVKPALFQKTTY